jgi:hypothetical protein
VASALKLLPAAERAQARPHLRALQRDVRTTSKAEAAGLARRAGKPGHAPPPHEPQGALAAIRPRRAVTGPVTLDRVPVEARAGRRSPRWSGDLFAVLSWCNGRRSLAEACHLAARELRRERALTPDEMVKRIDPSAPSMLDYFEFLRGHGYVTW